MRDALETSIHWRSRATVSVSAAAQIAGRSTTWIRNRLTDGTLEDDPATARPVAVRVDSLARIVDLQYARRRQRTIYLAVDNTRSIDRAR